MVRVYACFSVYHSRCWGNVEHAVRGEGIMPKSRKWRGQPRSAILLRAASLAAPVVIAVSATKRASAANLWWDVNGTTSGASGNAVATGTWDGTLTRWNSDSSGDGSGTISGVLGSTNIGVFSAGSNATGTFTVTVSGTQAAQGF